MNKFVRTKSHTGSKLSKIFLQQLYTGWTVVLHLCCVFFSVASDGATTERQIYNRVFGQFPTNLSMDSVANASIWTLFSTSVTGPEKNFVIH